MIEETDVLRQLVAAYMARVLENLQSTVPEILSNRIIYTNAWSNSNGMITAYVTCYPFDDVSQESIDAVISLDLSSQKVRFTADICRSNGELITEIADHDIPRNNTSDALVREVDRLSKAASEDITTHLKVLLRSSND